GGAPWFSRGLLPLGLAGRPHQAALVVAGPTATTPTMTRSTRHGRHPGSPRAGRTTTTVSAGGSATGRPVPPRRHEPGIAAAGLCRRTSRAGVAAGGWMRQVAGEPAALRTSG